MYTKAKYPRWETKGQSNKGNRKQKPKREILLLDFSHMEGFSEVTCQSKLSRVWSESCGMSD